MPRMLRRDAPSKVIDALLPPPPPSLWIFSELLARSDARGSIVVRSASALTHDRRFLDVART